jgi:hypothetical protein
MVWFVTIHKLTVTYTQTSRSASPNIQVSKLMKALWHYESHRSLDKQSISYALSTRVYLARMWIPCRDVSFNWLCRCGPVRHSSKSRDQRVCLHTRRSVHRLSAIFLDLLTLKVRIPVEEDCDRPTQTLLSLRFTSAMIWISSFVKIRVV